MRLAHDARPVAILSRRPFELDRVGSVASRIREVNALSSAMQQMSRGLACVLRFLPAELVRKDKHFKELGLDPDAYTTEDDVVSLLLEHPKLMQRPIVIRGERAVIARPSEKVEELL